MCVYKYHFDVEMFPFSTNVCISKAVVLMRLDRCRLSLQVWKVFHFFKFFIVCVWRGEVEEEKQKVPSSQQSAFLRPPCSNINNVLLVVCGLFLTKCQKWQRKMWSICLFWIRHLTSGKELHIVSQFYSISWEPYWVGIKRRMALFPWESSGQYIMTTVMPVLYLPCVWLYNEY